MPIEDRSDDQCVYIRRKRIFGGFRYGMSEYYFNDTNFAVENKQNRYKFIIPQYIKRDQSCQE